MSDSEENRSGASSALLNIASAYSDSESSQEANEDFKSPKSLGGLLENLRAEIRKSESEVTKASDGQSRTNSSLAGHAGDVEKSQSVTKIVRLDSGKVVKISTSPGSKASEARQEEAHAKQAPATEVINSFRSPDSIAPDQQTPNDNIPSSGGNSSFGTVFNNTPGPETIEPDKVGPVVDKAILGEGKTCEVNQNACTAKDIEVGAGNFDNDKECFHIRSELNGKAESANLTQDTSAESGNTGFSKVMGTKNSKESAKLEDEKNVESRAQESVMKLAEEASGEVESFDPSEGHLLSSSSAANFLAGGDFGDRERDISESLNTFQEPSPIQDLDITLDAESSDLELKTESNILNAYLKSKFEEEEAKEPEAEFKRKDSAEAETSEVTAQPENRFDGAEMEEIEKSTTAGSVADDSNAGSLEKEVEIVVLEPSENSCSGIDEETLTNNSDVFEIKPRPELKSTSRFERVKARPPVGVAEAATKKTESELQASSPALYKMLESCDSHQPTPAEPDVKKTTGSGPVKLKRNFGFISAAANEQQEKRFRSEELECNRSDDDLSDITILPPSPEISGPSQRLDSVRSPPKTQIPAQSTFHQEPYQTAFGKINSSSNQAFQSLKKSPQSVPQVSQRVTRREEYKRTLPLILRKAEVSSSKREASKLEDLSSKVSPKKEEVYSNVSSMSTEAGISMGTVSSESREQSTSVPFSSSSSNQDMSNSEGPIDFGNVISSSIGSKETKVPPLTGDSGSDNAMPPPTDGDETKQPTSFLSQPTPPVEMPTIIVPKKRGRPRKFPLPEPGPLVVTWPTQEKSKATPKTSKRRKSGKTKAEKDPVVETPKKRSLPRYKKKKKPGEGEEAEVTRSFNKKGRMEVMTEGCKPVTVNQITEYFWPPISSLPAGEKPEGLMIQEQISEYLGVKSFKRKYPSIKRRPVDMEERNYLQENGYVSENMCDMGLTAVYSADIIEIMYNDFPHKFEEYRKHTREKKIKEQKALREKQAAENMDPRKEALESAVSWNTEFNKTRLMDKPKRSYNYDVLLGEWYERKFEEEYKLAMYLKKKERGQLLLSKVRRLFSNLLKDVQLSLPTRGLAYGGIIQLMAPDVIGCPPLSTKGIGNKGLVLAVTLESEDVDYKQDFEDNLLVVGSPVLRPCVRNSFYIDPEDKGKEGQPLCFGDVFSLRCAAETEVPLYVSVPVLSPFGTVGKSGFPIPRLSMHRGFDARFRVLHLMQEKWLETQGLPVSPFEKVLVVHAPVNIPLCAESLFWENSLFSPECEISVHSTLNLKKEYEATNQWIFVVGHFK